MTRRDDFLRAAEECKFQVALAQTSMEIAGDPTGALFSVMAREARNARLLREAAGMAEALEPSGDNKAAYIGEFSFNHVVRDENGDEDYEPITVPWTTIKEIMKAISDRAAQTQEDA